MITELSHWVVHEIYYAIANEISIKDFFALQVLSWDEMLQQAEWET